jgi:hypothetical protein
MILDITYLDGWYPSGLLRDRQAKVNALRELQSPALRFGDLRRAWWRGSRVCAGGTVTSSVLRTSFPLGEVGGVGFAPAFWADVDAIRAG